MITNCLNNSGLLKLYPDVCVANYGNTHKSGLSLLLPFQHVQKQGSEKHAGSKYEVVVHVGDEDFS